jgi:hypothetical protein
LNAKLLALMSFVTGEPQVSWISRAGADIFWSASNRPHF